MFQFVCTEKFGCRGGAPKNAELLVAHRKRRRPKGQDVRGHHRGLCDLLGTAVFRHISTAPTIWQSFWLWGEYLKQLVFFNYNTINTCIIINHHVWNSITQSSDISWENMWIHGVRLQFISLPKVLYWEYLNFVVLKATIFQNNI